MKEFELKILSSNELTKVKGGDGDWNGCSQTWVNCSCGGYIGFDANYNSHMSVTNIGEFNPGTR